MICKKLTEISRIIDVTSKYIICIWCRLLENIGNRTEEVCQIILGLVPKQKINTYKYVHMNVKLEYHNSEYIFGKHYVQFFIIISYSTYLFYQLPYSAKSLFR